MNLLPEVSQIAALGRWNLISEAERERKSGTWGELWLMQELIWWSRRSYYEDPEVFKDLLVERQKPGLFSLERLLLMEALSAGWGSGTGELSTKSLPCPQSSRELGRTQRTADLGQINRRSVKTWNDAAFFPQTETLMIYFFPLEGLNLNERKWGENVPDFSVWMNELKEAPMCLSSWKDPCFDGALMDFSKDSLNASPSSIGNSYVLKLAPCHVYLCPILPSKIASLLSCLNIQSSIST